MGSLLASRLAMPLLPFVITAGWGESIRPIVVLVIARELMNRQHAWISQNGFASVETGAQQDNLAMTRLNLMSGFQVVGIRFKDLGPEITYEKRFVTT